MDLGRVMAGSWRGLARQRCGAPGRRCPPRATTAAQRPPAPAAPVHPGMQRQADSAPVHRQKHPATQQRIQGDRHGLKPPGAGQAPGCCNWPPHRVGQHTQAVQLHQHGGLAQPSGAQAGLRRQAPSHQRVGHRQPAAGHAALPSAQKNPPSTAWPARCRAGRARSGAGCENRQRPTVARRACAPAAGRQRGCQKSSSPACAAPGLTAGQRAPATGPAGAATAWLSPA